MKKINHEVDIVTKYEEYGNLGYVNVGYVNIERNPILFEDNLVDMDNYLSKDNRSLRITVVKGYYESLLIVQPGDPVAFMYGVY